MFKGVQFSLEIPFIPMRKLTTLFVIYVRKLFSPDVEKITEKKSKFLSEAIIESLNQKTPRAGIKNPNAIEYFYVNHLVFTISILQFNVLEILCDDSDRQSTCSSLSCWITASSVDNMFAGFKEYART